MLAVIILPPPVAVVPAPLQPPASTPFTATSTTAARVPRLSCSLVKSRLKSQIKKSSYTLLVRCLVNIALSANEGQEEGIIKKKKEEGADDPFSPPFSSTFLLQFLFEEIKTAR